MTSSRVLPTALAVLATALLAAADAPPDRPTDGEIALAIDGELFRDPAVRSNEVEIAVDDGIVTLTGTVEHLLARDRAARIARAVRGVRGVIDRLQVETPPVDDLALYGEVEAALFTSPPTDAYQIETEVEDGRVTLRGTVDSWAERMLAGRVVKGVAGVRELDNQLEVTEVGRRPDREIEEDVEALLRADEYVDAVLIHVRVDRGEVILSGVVGSAAERDRARERAWVHGVHAVDVVDLEVRPWAEDEQTRDRPAAGEIGDDELYRALRAALRQDPRVDAGGVQVLVDDGVVRLHGRVASLDTRRVAGRTAANTVGVWRVLNHLQVWPPSDLGDADLALAVERALARDAYVERFQLTAEARDGIVTLRGTVDSAFEKARAEDAAGRVPGVLRVVNALVIGTDRWPLRHDAYVDPDWDADEFDWYAHPGIGYPHRSDRDLTTRIEDQLRWNAYLDPGEIVVEVEDGAARLTGIVDTAEQRAQATAEAIEGGARLVDNDLQVRFGPPAPAPSGEDAPAGKGGGS